MEELSRRTDPDESLSGIQYMGRSPVKKRRPDSDDEIQFMGRSPPGKNKAKGKAATSIDGISDVVRATWSKGDDDMEPSAKMVKLIKLLKKWDACGDKTICYSQCMPLHHYPLRGV